MNTALEGEGLGHLFSCLPFLLLSPSSIAFLVIHFQLVRIKPHLIEVSVVLGHGGFLLLLVIMKIEEFNQNAEEFEKENPPSTWPDKNCQESGKIELLCQHKGKEPHFAHGLCRSCYKDFIELSGGLNGGSEPPAFQVAERDRLARASIMKEGGPDEAVPESASATAAPENLDTSSDDKIHQDDNIPSVTDETDNLSDIDDVEVNCYLNSEQESRYKKIIWEELNKEYLEEQAAKEAAAAAAFKDFGEASDDVLAARKLAAAAAVAKSREQRKRKRAESKNVGPALTAAEASRQMLKKKGLSSKINYDVLEKLFDESLPPSAKKPRMESHHDDHNASGKYANKEGNEAEKINLGEEQNEECVEEDIAEEIDGDQLYNQNEEEKFYYDEDDNDNFDDD
ncbi:hypothetical protein ACH5RR_017918 [Cinchona calisaya]|uniref:Brf1 TBP-binding domain-containing protein n=1 Tax=Cinchona calisaya TaxID=153742 RepID=A0ABD2ZKW8_9GENT